MRRYDLSRAAQLDVLDLFDYARSYDEASETRFADALVDCFERIAEFPLSGRDRSEILTGLRSVPIKSLRTTVFYAPLSNQSDRIRIVRVLRQERDVAQVEFGVE